MTTEIIPVNRIQQALQKENITEQVIAGLRTKYLGLTVKDENDKEGYAIVRAARIECKELRVLATKIAKAGREEAIAEQKAWIAAEKDVTGKIGEVEEYLEKQEAIVADAEKRKKQEQEEKERKEQEERERLAREKAQGRINDLIKFGVAITWQEAVDMPDSVFDLRLKNAKVAFEEAQEKKKKEDAQRAEEDRIRKEEQKKFEEEKQRQAEERKKLDEEKRKAELERIAEEARLKGIKEAEQKAEREKQEKLDREKKEKEEQERLAALKPEKEKIEAYAKALVAVVPPDIKSIELMDKMTSFNNSFVYLLAQLTK